MAALVDRHESLSPASMDGSIYESGHMDERSAKSKIIFVISGSLISYLVFAKGKFKLPVDFHYQKKFSLMFSVELAVEF